MKKYNCWEFKKCGRTPGGEHERDLGICPAAAEARMHTVHGGKNAGRACWVIAGTMCGGAVQGSFAKKNATCEECDFFKLVRQEEGADYKAWTVLIKKLTFG